jgi:CBS domain-containing protein
VLAKGVVLAEGPVFTEGTVFTAGTVGSAMLLDPTVHPAGLSVAQARDAFEASAKRHLLLLVRDSVLLGTLTRDDLARAADPEAPALPLACLDGRTVAPDVPLARSHETMCRRGIRRLAVIDGRGRLLGLLCLKRSRRGFCTDDGVAALRRARRG